MRRALVGLGALIGLSAFSGAAGFIENGFVHLDIDDQGSVLQAGAFGGGGGGLMYDSTGGGAYASINDWGYPTWTTTAVFDGVSVGTYAGSMANIVVGNTTADGTNTTAVTTTLSNNGLLHTRLWEFATATFVKVTDTYTNVSGVAKSLAAVDSFDPDQGIPYGTGFGTDNTNFEPGIHEVDSWQISPWVGIGVGLWSYDANSRAFIAAGLDSLDPFEVSQPNGFADQGIALAFDHGMLGAGECTTSVWYIGLAGSPVPEPSSVAAMVLGLGALAARRRRKA